MTKKWIGINLLLLVIAVFAGYQLYASVQQFKKDNDLAKITPASSLSQKTAQDNLPAPLMADNYHSLDYAVIPEKNVFSVSRSREDSADTPAVTGTMPIAQKPSLVGVILSEKQKVATIQPPPERGRAAPDQMMEIGDTYEGYEVTEIESDHIVLNNGNLKEIIYLNDTSQPAQRTKTRIVATQVIPIGARTTTASAPTYVVFDRNGRTTSVQIPTPPQAPNSGATGAQRNIITVNPTAVLSGMQQPAAQAPQATQATPQPATTTGTPTRRSRVIQSPFGDITRNPQN